MSEPLLIQARTRYDPLLKVAHARKGWIMMDEDGSLWDAKHDRPYEEGEEPLNRRDHVGPPSH